jgi:hypothetical protein
MPVVSGNTSTSATSTAYDIPTKIETYSLVNKSGGSITVTLSVLYGSTNVTINSQTITSGGVYLYQGDPIVLLADRQIYLLTTGSVDYYFSLDDGLKE